MSAWVPKSIRRWHKKGITGKGVKIYVDDNFRPNPMLVSHGESVARIIRDFAPEAEVYTPGGVFYRKSPLSYEEYDIINMSYGGPWRYGYAWDSAINSTNAHNEDFIRVIAAGNIPGICVNGQSCSTLAVGHTGIIEDGQYKKVDKNLNIVVGATDIKHKLTRTGAGILMDDYIAANEWGPNRRRWLRNQLWEHGGTSYACPKVTGTLALIMQAYPDFSYLEVKEKLLEGASYRRPRARYGHGRLNINKALR